MASIRRGRVNLARAIAQLTEQAVSLGDLIPYLDADGFARKDSADNIVALGGGGGGGGTTQSSVLAVTNLGTNNGSFDVLPAEERWLPMVLVNVLLPAESWIATAYLQFDDTDREILGQSRMKRAGTISPESVWLIANLYGAGGIPTNPPAPIATFELYKNGVATGLKVSQQSTNVDPVPGPNDTVVEGAPVSWVVDDILNWVLTHDGEHIIDGIDEYDNSLSVVRMGFALLCTAVWD